MALPALLKLVFRFVPSMVTELMITTPIKATISPYSMAVAPDSSDHRRSRNVKTAILPTSKRLRPQNLRGVSDVGLNLHDMG